MSCKSGRFSSCSNSRSLAERPSPRRWQALALGLPGTTHLKSAWCTLKYLPGSSRSHRTIGTHLATAQIPEIRVDCGVQRLLAPPKALNGTLWRWRGAYSFPQHLWGGRG